MDSELIWKRLPPKVDKETGHRIVTLCAVVPVGESTTRIWREDHWANDLSPYAVKLVDGKEVPANWLVHQAYWHKSRDKPHSNEEECLKEALGSAENEVSPVEEKEVTAEERTNEDQHHQ
ncbi:MAG TPA: hypothetical protein PLB89_05340 [Flavobacteriales bacterium]|nr:hypothetical protein [Flavobacteriales bacterium]